MSDDENENEDAQAVGEGDAEQEVVGTLTAELIKGNLSQCGKAGSSGRKAFALQRLEVRGKALQAFDAEALEFGQRLYALERLQLVAVEIQNAELLEKSDTFKIGDDIAR